jgi:DNA polymerase bacteriophage-type
MPKVKPARDMAVRWVPATAPEEFEALYKYNERDVVTELEACSRIADLTPREFAVWQLDQKINRRGMQIDVDGVHNCIAIVEQARARDNAKLRVITNGAVEEYTKAADTIRWLATQGVTVYELDEETVAETLKLPGLPPGAHEVLRIRQRLSFGSVNKLYAFRSHVCNDGRLRDQFVYYGAHTGLWNGRAVQPANLYKGIFSKPEDVERAFSIIACRSLELIELEYPDVYALEIVASCLRSLIIAAPGHTLMSADFTAIQAVITAALAGEQWQLDVFRTHGKIYEAMASQLTGVTLEDYAAYKKANGKHHPDRQLGKLASLSGNFGAWISGWKRFGADKILGSDEAIKALILKTRASIPAIVEMWGGQTRNKFNRAPDGSRQPCRPELYGLEGAAISAVMHPGQAFAYRQMRYQMHEDCLYYCGPSGTFMRFHAPRLGPSDRPYAEPWELELSYEGWSSESWAWVRDKLYGGVLTQNAVSHEASEVQKESLLRLDAHGYLAVHHCHDEATAEVPNGHGSLEQFTSLVRTLPEWAREADGTPWPIKVPDAWQNNRYGKFE